MNTRNDDLSKAVSSYFIKRLIETATAPSMFGNFVPKKPTPYQRIAYYIRYTRQKIGFWIAGYKPEDQSDW